jgi:hypothetical protein
VESLPHEFTGVRSPQEAQNDILVIAGAGEPFNRDEPTPEPDDQPLVAAFNALDVPLKRKHISEARSRQDLTILQDWDEDLGLVSIIQWPTVEAAVGVGPATTLARAGATASAAARLYNAARAAVDKRTLVSGAAISHVATGTGKLASSGRVLAHAARPNGVAGFLGAGLAASRQTSPVAPVMSNEELAAYLRWRESLLDGRGRSVVDLSVDVTDRRRQDSSR